MSVKSRSALKESGPFLRKDVVRLHLRRWDEVIPDDHSTGLCAPSPLLLWQFLRLCNKP